MLNISASQMNVIAGRASGHVGIMGELILASGALRVSSFSWDFTDANSVFWAGAAGVVSYGPVPSITSLTGASLTIVWSGASPELIAAARDAEILNAPFNQYLFIVNQDGVQIGDPINLYSGFCEIPDIDPDPENPTITVSVEGDSVTLNRPNNYRMTPERIRRDFPSEAFFDFVASLQDKDLTVQ